jgi:hypothetical protein
MKRSIALIGVLVLALAGCSVTPKVVPKVNPNIQGHDYSGTVAAPVRITYFPLGKKEHTVGDQCVTGDGYNDIKTGAQVVITDSAGATVGIGSLIGGELTASLTNPDSMIGATCTFKFFVHVAKKSDFYGVHVGNEARGVVQYSAGDVAGGVDLVIGH